MQTLCHENNLNTDKIVKIIKWHNH